MIMVLRQLFLNTIQHVVSFSRITMAAVSSVYSATTTGALKYDRDNSNSISSSNTFDSAIEVQHFLIVGLGNYGLEDTRHSVGMRTVDMLAVKLNLNWTENVKQNGGFVCSTEMKSGEQPFKVTLLKPKALMNINGPSVLKTAKLLSVPACNIFLTHDELDRNLGKFHLKEGGSAGGHNGVLSCFSYLNSKEMPRLRIGISRPASKVQIVPYVLGPFTKEELVIIDATIEQALDFLLEYIAKRVSSSVKEPLRLHT